jgi:hypothetical protein
VLFRGGLVRRSHNRYIGDHYVVSERTRGFRTRFHAFRGVVEHVCCDANAGIVVRVFNSFDGIDHDTGRGVVEDRFDGRREGSGLWFNVGERFAHQVRHRAGNLVNDILLQPVDSDGGTW